jgi:Spy/CpxP family protein refolding chaperone
MSDTLLRALRAALRAGLRASFGLAIVSAAASAQAPGGGPGGPGGPGGGERMRAMQAMMFEGITLSATQQQSVDSLRTAFRERMQAAEPEQRRGLRDEQQKAIRGLLTADQAKQYDANLEKLRANRPARPNGAGSLR